MESLIIAALLPISVVFTLLFWTLLVRPHVIVQHCFIVTTIRRIVRRRLRLPDRTPPPLEQRAGSWAF